MSNSVTGPQRHSRQKLAFWLCSACCHAAWCWAPLGGILIYVFIHGISAISWEFLTAEPKNSMTEGGIFPAIMGTLYLTVGAILVALPLGVAAADLP